MNDELMLAIGALRAQAETIAEATNLWPDSYMVPADMVEPHQSVTVFGKPATLTDGEWGLFYGVRA